MYVVATAGHVDHGKSRLIRALTGIEPDRWAEERRRGLTIDLGFAWTTLPSGADVAFVDVPGHERFLANMLAGLGAAPVVMFVVAADQGWQAQSDDHRDAIAALDIDRGVIVVTRCDLASPDRIEHTVAAARHELRSTRLAAAPVVRTSAATSLGLQELAATLDTVLARSAAAQPDAPVRLWLDRSFVIRGVGTVVTGTLSAGTIHTGGVVTMSTAGGVRPVTVRGLEVQGRAHLSVGPVSRVAVNLRGVHTAAIGRGDVLLTPGAWRHTDVVDVRLRGDPDLTAVPEHLVAHIGTAAVPIRLRPFDADHARIHLTRPLPLLVGDRIVLRDPGTRILGGARILDAEPADLTRRGEGSRRAHQLAAMPEAPDQGAEVARRGAVRIDHLRRLGVIDAGPTPPAPAEVTVIGSWWVDTAVISVWVGRLRSAVTAVHDDEPTAAGLSRGAAAAMLGMPDDSDLLAAVIEAAEIDSVDGFLAMPGRSCHLGHAEDAVAALERRLADDPFAAPEAGDLAALGLGDRELAAAERTRRLLRIGDGVVLAPTAPARAMRTLAGLDQPFTTSAARRALGTTRRVAIPLLEHLDRRGWTRRIDAGHREVVR